MSHNTFGDINIRPHHPEVYYPDPLDYSHPLNIDEEEGYDEFTHSQTDDPTDIFGEREPVEEYTYDRELGKVATKIEGNEGVDGEHANGEEDV